MWNPFVKGTHPLGDDGLNDETIERERDEVRGDDSSLAWRKHREVLTEDAGAGGNREGRLDDEVAGLALDATKGTIMLDMVLEGAGGGDLPAPRSAPAFSQRLVKLLTVKSISKGLEKSCGSL